MLYAVTIKIQGQTRTFIVDADAAEEAAAVVSDWAGKDEGNVPQVELINEFVGDSVYELCTFEVDYGSGIERPRGIGAAQCLLP